MRFGLHRPAGKQGGELLAVARSVFLQFGFTGSTMQEVAARAGISKASLYRAHPSKDELFAAVVADWASQGRGSMRPYLERLLTADDLHAELAGPGRRVGTFETGIASLTKST